MGEQKEHVEGFEKHGGGEKLERRQINSL